MGLFNKVNQAYSLVFGSRERAFGVLSQINDAIGNPLFYNGGYNDAKEVVTPSTGEKIATVFNCINVIAQDVSRLPFRVRQFTEEGKIDHPDHAITRLINNQPNPYMSAYQFRYCMTFLGESRGNSYAWIERDGNNQPIALYPIDPDQVFTIKDPNLGMWFYQINGVIFNQSDIFHYKTMSLDGFNGISKIQWNAQLIGLKMKTHKYKSHIIGKSPAGYLSAKVSGKQAVDIAKGWTQKIETGEVPFLYGDVEYKHLMLSPEQTDIINSEKWTDTMTFGMWRIQPVMVSVHEDSNYSNAEQQNIIHAKYTLAAPIVAWEQEADRKLFSERNKTSKYPLYTKINIEGLLRGDTSAQIEMIRTMVTLGIWNQNDVLRLYDQRTVDGGDEYFIQGAMVKKSAAKTADDLLRNLDQDIQSWNGDIIKTQK